jgi:two-component system sensor histidine kinase RegB
VQVSIAIRDWGPGLPDAIRENPGKAVMLGTAQGMGIGLMLSHASVERFGGHIELRPLDDGAEARLILPNARSNESDHESQRRLSAGR